MEEVKRIRKAKGFYEELAEMEEMQTAAVIRLMKSKLLMEIVNEGKPISREHLISPEIQSYKSKKIEAFRAAQRQNPSTLLEEQDDDFTIERYAPKKKKSAEPKKTTLEETHELWQQKLSIADIARTRKLTETTIMSHFAGLIQAGKVRVEDVLPQDRIIALTEAFKGFEGEALGGLKEKLGDEFTWGELRLFRASLQND